MFQKIFLYCCIALWLLGLAAVGATWDNETLRTISGCVCIFGAAAIVLGKFWLNKLEPDADFLSYEEYLNNLYIAATIAACFIIQLVIRMAFGQNYHFFPLAASGLGALVGWLVWPPEADGEKIKAPKESPEEPSIITALAQMLADEAGD